MCVCNVNEAVVRLSTWKLKQNKQKTTNQTERKQNNQTTTTKPAVSMLALFKTGIQYQNLV